MKGRKERVTVFLPNGSGEILFFIYLHLEHPVDEACEPISSGGW